MAFNNILLDKEDLNKLLKELANVLDEEDILTFGVCGVEH